MKILYFATLAFDDLKQRPQEIAAALAEKHEVWYIEPTISLIGTLKDKSLNCHANAYDLSPTLHVIRLDGRFALPIRLQFLDPLRLNTVSERIQLSNLFKLCDVIWVGYEVWERLLPASLTGLLVYDKIAVMVENLSAMGADVTETEDGMIIRGGRPLHGAVIESHLDHRIAMTFAVTALCAEGVTQINGAECVNISYPQFYQDLENLFS